MDDLPLLKGCDHMAAAVTLWLHCKKEHPKKMQGGMTRCSAPLGILRPEAAVLTQMCELRQPSKQPEWEAWTAPKEKFGLQLVLF